MALAVEYHHGGKRIIVNNAVPATTVTIPTNGDTLGNGSTTLLSDGSASPGVTHVQSDLTGQAGPFTATATIYGWLATLSIGCDPPSDCPTTVPLPYSI